MARSNSAVVDTPLSRASLAFGSMTQLAKALGKHPSELSAWKRRGGYIPVKQQQAVLDAAREHGKKLKDGDVIGASHA